MARQRRTLEEQIAELTTRGRSERAQIMATPAMAPVGPDMIEDEAIQSGHVSNGAIGDIHIQDNAILNQHLGENAVAMENLDETLKGTLASLAENEAVLATAGERLDAADERLSNLFEEVEVAIPKAITDQATKTLSDAKGDATTKANNAVSTALAATARGANVVVNGSFEQDFAGWDKEVTQAGGNYGIDTAVFRSGTRSFWSTKNGGFRQSTIPVKVGETWEYSLWFKTDDAYTSANAGGLRLQAKGPDGDTWKDVASTTLKASPAGWTQSVTRYVVPEGINQIRARFAFNYTGGAKVWVDDISLVNITAELAAAADATAKASKALEDAKTHATNAANTAKTDAIAGAESFTITKMAEVANSKNATFYGTAVPTASAPKGSLAGDTYRRRDSKGNIIGEYEWDGTKWTQRKMTSESMTAVDVGVLTAGSAVIDDAVARTIAAGTADIQKANIKNLVVTEGANLNEAVAKRIAADTGEFIELSTDRLKAGTANIDTNVVNKLYGEVVESRLMKASQMEIGGVNNYASISSVVDLWDYKTAHSTVVNTSYASSTQGRALRFQSNAGITSIYSKRFVVTPGESLSVEATFRNDGGVDVVGEMTLGLQYQDAAGATLAWDIYATTTKAKHTHATREYQKGTSVVPAGAAYARVIGSTRAIADATKVDKAVYGYIIDPIVRTNVNAELMVDGTIKARHMQIVGDNLIADSKFLNADMNAERISSSTLAAGTASFVKDDVSTSNVFRLTEHSATNRSLNLMGSAENARIPVRKGDVLKFEVWYRVRGNAVADVTDKSQIRFAIYQDAPTGAYIRYVGVGGYEAITKVGSAWYVHRSEYTITQDDVGFVRPQVQLRNPAFSGEMEFKWPSMTNAATSGKLESNLVLATKITAGDPNGTRAEMSPQGFKVYAKPPGEASAVAATEVVRMGVAETDDYFAVTKADGQLAATISQDGAVSARAVSADETLYYKGEEMTGILDRLPRGVVAMATRNTSSPQYDSAGLYPYLHVTFPVESGRLYRISTNPINFEGDGTALSHLMWRQDGPAVAGDAATGYLTRAYSAGSSMGFAWQTPHVHNRVFRCWWTGTLSILLATRSIGSSKIKLLGDGGYHLNHILIEDIGILPQDTGEAQDGKVTPPPTKQNYTKTWTASGIRSYQGNGQPYNFNTTKMFQGLSPAGYGNLGSCAVFPDMTKDLSNATINSVKVYLYFEHWYYNAGGTARIGLIGKSLPATFQSGGLATSSGGWPKPGGRWVDIPSNLWNGFKTGQWGGLSLNGDGSYGTYGYANNAPQIKINYTK